MSRQNRAASVEPDPLFFATVFVGLLAVGTVPRLLRLFIKPDTVCPLHGRQPGAAHNANVSKGERRSKLATLNHFSRLLKRRSFMATPYSVRLKAKGASLPSVIVASDDNEGTAVRD